MVVVLRLLFFVCVLLGFPSLPVVLASSAQEAVTDNPTLSDAEIAKLVKLAVERGNDSTIDHQVTDALGLTVAGQTVTYRQLAIVLRGSSTHAFHQTGDGGYLFGIVNTHNENEFTAIRTDRRFELTAAVFKKPDQAPVVIPVNNAKATLKDELTFWHKVAAKF